MPKEQEKEIMESLRKNPKTKNLSLEKRKEITFKIMNKIKKDKSKSVSTATLEALMEEL